MNKTEIIATTEEKFQDLIDFLEGQDDKKWELGPEGKWTTGQHIIHLIQSGKPLNKALSMPMFVLRYKFGKPNRPVRSYDEVKTKYKTKLAAAQGPILSPFSQNMPDTSPGGKAQIIGELKKVRDVLLKKINKISEKDMDKNLIPHPLLGRMHIREMLMWNAIHVEHHFEILEEKYG